MKFDLKRPCPECPFQKSGKGVRLTSGRIKEIGGMMLSSDGGTFACHKTLESGTQSHCAGALIFAEQNGNATHMMRVAERLRIYNHTELDMDANVFESVEEWLESALDRSRE